MLPRPEYSGPWNSEQEEHSEEDRSKDHAQPPVITGGKIAAVGIDQTRRIREGRYDAIKVKFAVGVRLRRQRKSRRFRLEDDLSVSHRTCAIVNRLAAEDAIFTADVGTPTVWIARYISMNGRRRILGSFNHGSMANALPPSDRGSSGVSRPPSNLHVRRWWAFHADGGIAHASTAEGASEIIVYQNDALSFVELEMKAAGIISFGTDLENPDFAKLADACGIFGRNVEDPGELEQVLRAAFDHSGPALVSVKVAKHELTFPPTIDFEEAKGFGIYMIKAMLNGRGDEILDLAATNLRAFL